VRNNGNEYDQYEVETEALEEYGNGFNARVFGEPYDPDASADWLRGWQAAGDNAGDDE